MASTARTPESIDGRTLLFRVGPTIYGCDIQAVREIVPYRRATRLPGAPSYVQGLINVRGTIVTVLDVGVRLDPEGTRAPASDGSIIMVEHGSRTVGLVVQEVLDVRRLTLGDEDVVDAVGVVRGVGRVDEAVVVALDVHTLIKQVLLT